MTRSQLTFTTSTSLGSMAYLSDAHLKGIVHFKLFIAVQGSGETIEHSIDSVSAFPPFSDAQPPTIEIAARESVGTDIEVETVVIVTVWDFVQHASHDAL